MRLSFTEANRQPLSRTAIGGRGLTKAYRGFFLTSIIHGLVLRGSHLGLGKGPKFQERPASPMDSTRPPGGSVVSRALSSSEEPCSLHKLERFHVRGSGAWTKSLLSSQARGAPSRREDCQRASGAAGWSPSSFPRPCLFSGQRLLLSPPRLWPAVFPAPSFCFSSWLIHMCRPSSFSRA